MNLSHIHCGHWVEVGHISVWQCCRCGAETGIFPSYGWEKAKEEA